MIRKCLISLLLAITLAESDVVSRAAYFHVDQFGPPGPEEGFLEHLDAAAIDVAAPAAAPCKRAFRLVIMTVVSSDELHGGGQQPGGSSSGVLALALIQSLSKIARQTSGYVSSDPSSCAEPSAVPTNGTSSSSGGGAEEQFLHLESALVVVAVDLDAASACASAQSNTRRHRCHVGSHVKLKDAVGSHHAADRSRALGFAKVRYVLNAVSLGFGVLYIAPGVGGALVRDPLPPLLLMGRMAEAIEASDAVDVCGGGGDALGAAGVDGQGPVGSGGQQRLPASARGAVFLVRPTAAAVRCTFDWITSMWLDRKRGRGAGGSGGGVGGGSGGDGSSGGGAGGGIGGDGSSSDAGKVGLDGALSPHCCSEAVHFGRVMPKCLELFGSGLGAVSTGAFSNDVVAVHCR